MSVNKDIRGALVGFGDPVECGEYIAPPGTSLPASYYTFNYSTVGTNFGDNLPGHDRYLIQVHFNCPHTFDIVQRVEQTRHALFAAGFTWPQTVNASDESGQHIVFECETVERIEFDG